MVSSNILLLVLGFCFLISYGFLATEAVKDLNFNHSGLELPHHLSFNAVSSSSDCGLSELEKKKEAPLPVKIHLKHSSDGQEIKPRDCLTKSTAKDLTRIHTLHKRIIEKKNQNTISRLKNDGGGGQRFASSPDNAFTGQLTASLESGVSHGSGEYFIDVFIGTPPKHFSLILDTGSDLNWIQCVPCHDCFEQTGPYYNPNDSTSFRNISCRDPRCHLVSSPDPPPRCTAENQTCPYYYWYGDSSNTTGDFALETFTVNLTAHNGKTEFRKVKNVMFGCGHWNRGLFHGAAGLLGLGRGPLSFSSQLRSFYGHSFSYCLVDRNSNASVSSKLIFGEDKDLLSHPMLNFTSFISGKENPVDTFYYVGIKSIIVGGEVLDIPVETFNLSQDGSGGTIIDSGTTLSYFADPAYKTIKDAFVKKIKEYPVVKDFPILDPCYNISGAGKLDFPSFGILFSDGAVWNFPLENYFIEIEADEVVCLAILGTPKSALSIIGNYQQQNFHILYDTERSRLGFAPTKCADM